MVMIRYWRQRGKATKTVITIATTQRSRSSSSSSSRRDNSGRSNGISRDISDNNSLDRSSGSDGDGNVTLITSNDSSVTKIYVVEEHQEGNVQYLTLFVTQY